MYRVSSTQTVIQRYIVNTGIILIKNYNKTVFHSYFVVDKIKIIIFRSYSPPRMNTFCPTEVCARRNMTVLSKVACLAGDARVKVKDAATRARLSTSKFRSPMVNSRSPKLPNIAPYFILYIRIPPLYLRHATDMLYISCVRQASRCHTELYSTYHGQP